MTEIGNLKKDIRMTIFTKKQTLAILLLGVSGISQDANAMQNMGNFSRNVMHYHGRGTMLRMNPAGQFRQNHITNNQHGCKEEAMWLCPIKEADIQLLSKAGSQLGEKVQVAKNIVLELHDLLNKTDNISYTTARHWDENLRDHVHYIHNSYEEIKKQRRATEAEEEAAMNNVIDALRSFTDALGRNLHGTVAKPIQTHTITQTKDAVTINLNAKSIENVEHIWTTNNFNWKNSKEVSKLERDIKKNFEENSDLQNYLLKSVVLIKHIPVISNRDFEERSVFIDSSINIIISDTINAGKLFSPKQIQLIQNSRTGLMKTTNSGSKEKIEEKVDIIYSDLASRIKEEYIEALSEVDTPLGEKARSIKNHFIQFDEIINKEKNRHRQHEKLITGKISDARSVWSPYFLELAEKYPNAKGNFNHLSEDTLYIATALEELMRSSGSDSRDKMAFVENVRLNFENIVERFLGMGEFIDDKACDEVIDIVRELFNTYCKENGTRRSKE